MKTVLEKPTKVDQKFAKETMLEFDKISKKKQSSSHVFLSFQFSGREESVEVPENVIRYLKFLLSNMADGKAIQISSVEPELSTQDAADLLGVSRPFFVKLLEEGKIPFKKIGTHRRVNLKDIQVYERKQKAMREKHLSYLAKQAQDLNLGYDI